MHLLLALLLLASLSCSVDAACHGNKTGLPIFTDAPVLINSTQYGKLYQVGGSENPVHLLHVYGTPYQMGQAHGQLLGPAVLNTYKQFLTYVDEQIEQYLQFFPSFLRKIIAQGGLKAGLDFEILVTRDYTPSHFEEEIQGLADAVGLTKADMWRFMLFPELIKASCTIVGAWGSASVDGGLYHLRALDWGIDNPLRQFPLITVYHPNAGNGHDFVTLGWTGFVGALTGYSEYVGAGEKVWLHYNGTDMRAGYPWHFLFRDMLQFDESVAQALDRINNASRTCSIYLGLGDHANGNFKVVEYSHDRVVVFGDDTPFPGFDPSPPQHPLIPDVAYVDKYVQPSTDSCLASLLQSAHGHIDAQALIDVTGTLQTGDLHAAVYDYFHNKVYVSVATSTVPYPPPKPDPTQPAYNSAFIELDMNVLFNV